MGNLFDKIKKLLKSDCMTNEEVCSRVKTLKKIGIRTVPFRPDSGLVVPIDAILDMETKDASKILNSL